VRRTLYIGKGSIDAVNSEGGGQFFHSTGRIREVFREPDRIAVQPSWNWEKGLRREKRAKGGGGPDRKISNEFNIEKGQKAKGENESMGHVYTTGGKDLIREFNHRKKEAPERKEGSRVGLLGKLYMKGRTRS